MADVTGPIATLRGHRSAPPDGQMCDTHPDRPAVARVQGETDSFGSEQHDLCAECLAEFKKAIAEDRVGVCDWCGKEAEDLRDRRDYDEGMAGPVYRVCGACVRAENARLAEELEESRRRCDDWDD